MYKIIATDVSLTGSLAIYSSNFNCISVFVFVFCETKIDFFFRENSRSTSKRGTTAVPPTGSLSGPFFGPLMDPCWPHIISPHLLPGSHVPAFSPQILPVCSLQRIHSKNELKPPTGYVRFSDHDLVIISETELFRTQLSTR